MLRWWMKRHQHQSEWGKRKKKSDSEENVVKTMKRMSKALRQKTKKLITAIFKKNSWNSLECLLLFFSRFQSLSCVDFRRQTMTTVSRWYSPSSSTVSFYHFNQRLHSSIFTKHFVDFWYYSLFVVMAADEKNDDEIKRKLIWKWKQSCANRISSFLMYLVFVDGS